MIGNISTPQSASIKLDAIITALNNKGINVTSDSSVEELAQAIDIISNDCTAVEANVLNGKTFFSKGTKKTGTMYKAANELKLANTALAVSTTLNRLNISLPRSGYYPKGGRYSEGLVTSNHSVYFDLGVLSEKGYMKTSEHNTIVSSLQTQLNNAIANANPKLIQSFSTDSGSTNGSLTIYDTFSTDSIIVMDFGEGVLVSMSLLKFGINKAADFSLSNQTLEMIGIYDYDDSYTYRNIVLPAFICNVMMNISCTFSNDRIDISYRDLSPSGKSLSCNLYKLY